ncbi:hypothetical protein GCM10027076_24720 [Nocardioides montaniterrae]
MLQLRAGQALGLLSIPAYNWWIGAIAAGMVTSPDGMFSDLEAVGQPHATLFGRLDMVSGALVVLGLLLMGAPRTSERLREWKLMLGFGVTGVIGGMYPYACPEGRDDACRDAEWSLQLPLHHYVHMASGIVEFALITMTVALMWRRVRDAAPSPFRSFVGLLGAMLAIGYPAIACSYLLDRFDAPVEALFFMVFAGAVAATVLEPEPGRVLVPAPRLQTATHEPSC